MGVQCVGCTKAYFRHSGGSRNPGFDMESPMAILEKLIAASAPQAGHFFLSGQEKVTKKKAAPKPPIPVLCMDAQMPRSTWMCESGRFSPRPGASRTRRAPKPRLAQTPARDVPRPRLRCSAAVTGPVPSNGNRGVKLGGTKIFCSSKL